MGNKRVITILAVIVIFTVTGMFVWNGTKETNSTKEEIISISPDARPISEVSKSAYDEMKNFQNQSEHFEFDDIRPYCPEVSTVYGFHFYDQNYKNITNEKEMLECQLNLASRLMEKEKEELLEDELVDDKFIVDKYWTFAFEKEYDSFGDFLNDEATNSQREPSNLGYIDQDEEKLLAFYVSNRFINVDYILGKCYEYTYDIRMKLEEGRTTLTQPRFVCEKVAEYYVYEDNDRLDDIWQLADGEMSVRDAVRFAENQINELVTLEDEQSDIQIKIARVQVYQVSEELYLYRYMVRREIGGVLCQTINNGSQIGRGDMNYDIGDAYQIEKDKIDMYDGPTKVMAYEKENESDKILPLGKVLELLEKSIGENSKYSVHAVELAYLNLYDNWMAGEEEGHGSVCWCIRCTNEQDYLITEFYVNALTGEITINSR